VSTIEMKNIEIKKKGIIIHKFMYNKFMIINFIVTKKMLPKFFGTIQFVVIKNNHTMIKLSLMTSHMSIVTNG
jgi:hypothetical protein